MVGDAVHKSLSFIMVLISNRVVPARQVLRALCLCLVLLRLVLVLTATVPAAAASVLVLVFVVVIFVVLVVVVVLLSIIIPRLALLATTRTAQQPPSPRLGLLFQLRRLSQLNVRLIILIIIIILILIIVLSIFSSSLSASTIPTRLTAMSLLPSHKPPASVPIFLSIPLTNRESFSPSAYYTLCESP